MRKGYNACATHNDPLSFGESTEQVTGILYLMKVVVLQFTHILHSANGGPFVSLPQGDFPTIFQFVPHIEYI